MKLSNRAFRALGEMSHLKSAKSLNIFDSYTIFTNGCASGISKRTTNTNVEKDYKHKFQSDLSSTTPREFISSNLWGEGYSVLSPTVDIDRLYDFFREPSLKKQKTVFTFWIFFFNLMPAVLKL